MGVMGTLQVLLLDREKDIYSVSFTAYQPGRRALRAKEIHGRDGLKKHLLGLNIPEDIKEKALRDVQRDGRCDLPNLIIG